ncbi:MAG: hypothetical protein ACTSYG_10875 [Candidatus Heimdallarchaeota archaeon]
MKGETLMMTNTKQKKEAVVEEVQKLEQENKVLKAQMSVFQDQFNLQNEGYFRQQLMMYLERIAVALETPLEESEELEKPNKEG